MHSLSTQSNILTILRYTQAGQTGLSSNHAPILCIFSIDIRGEEQIRRPFIGREGQI